MENTQILKSVYGDEYYIVRSKGEYDSIKFVNTGYECRARKHLVNQGRVFDPTKKLQEQGLWEDYVEEFKTNSGETFYSFKRNGKKVKVIFTEYNYTAEVFIDNARVGKVSNPYSISVYGQGYVGIFDKSLSYWKPAKQLWQNMMKRCYSTKDERGYYGTAFVDERWKSFENFLNDISKLDGFKGWLESKESGIVFNLDKDFIKKNNNVYSRHFCCFLPDSFNKSLGKKGKQETDWVSD